MEEIRSKAYAKVNIGLDVCGRRPDGYHFVNMVMQTVDIYDEICVRKLDSVQRPAGAGSTAEGSGAAGAAESSEAAGAADSTRAAGAAGSTKTASEDPGCDFPIRITSDRAGVPAGAENIAYKAAALVMKECGISCPVEINIKKNIPMAGGMAGGSTDAATVLKAMNELFECGLTQQDLDGLALKLGADVPFCLRQGTYLAQGIGEKLTKLKGLPQCAVLIANPGFEVSTGWAYGQLDVPGFDAPHPDIDGLCAAIGTGELDRICPKMGNLFETVVFPEHPELENIKKTMQSCGALAALMTGSGATMFGIFRSLPEARRAGEFLKRNTHLAFCQAAGFIS